jgi:hypothetical protein
VQLDRSQDHRARLGEPSEHCRGAAQAALFFCAAPSRPAGQPGQRIELRIRCEDKTGYVQLGWGDNRVLTVWLEGSADDWPQATVDGVGPFEMGYQRELATWYPVPTTDPASA